MELGDRVRADPGHAVEVLDRGEGAVCAAILDDAGREPRPDPGQGLELLGPGEVQVHAAEALGVDLLERLGHRRRRLGGDPLEPRLEAVARRRQEEQEDNEADEPLLSLRGRKHLEEGAESRASPRPEAHRRPGPHPQFASRQRRPTVVIRPESR